MNVTAMGRAGLTGVKGKMGAKVAQPVAERTPWSEEQIEAVIGAIFLALAFWQFLNLLRRVVRAGREGTVD